MFRTHADQRRRALQLQTICRQKTLVPDGVLLVALAETELCPLALKIIEYDTQLHFLIVSYWRRSTGG